MKQSTPLLFCLLFLAVTSAVDGFFQANKQPQQSCSTTALSSSSSSSSWSSSDKQKKSFDSTTDPHNTAPQSTTSSTNKKTVFTNVHYIPPVVPTRAAAGRVTHQQHGSTSSGSRSVDHHHEYNGKLWQGGQYFLEMGQSLRTIASGGGRRRIVLHANTNNGGDQNNKKNMLLLESRLLLLAAAGNAMQDIGVAWQAGDWEAVSYAALDASQTMELVAQSLNHLNNNNNDLQQAFAGVAVELKCLSNKKQGEPEDAAALNLQGLSLRLYQASRSTSSLLDLGNVVGGDSSTTAARGQLLETASQAAQKLAKLYGATSVYLPRRWKLWWHHHHHNSNNNKDSNRVSLLKENETDWQ